MPAITPVGRRRRAPPPTTYQLLIRVARPATVTVGRLGCFDFPAGYYIYTGSAKRAFGARLARHLRRDKPLRWHIDYLLCAPGVRITGLRAVRTTECSASRGAPGRVLVRGFGSSDCRDGCAAHLKFLGARVPLRWQSRFVRPSDADTGYFG